MKNIEHKDPIKSFVSIRSYDEVKRAFQVLEKCIEEEARYEKANEVEKALKTIRFTKTLWGMIRDEKGLED